MGENLANKQSVSELINEVKRSRTTHWLRDGAHFSGNEVFSDEAFWKVMGEEKIGKCRGHQSVFKGHGAILL